MSPLDTWLSVSTVRCAELRRNGRIVSCALIDEHGLRFTARSVLCADDAIEQALAKYESDMREAREQTERDDAEFMARSKTDAA